MRSRNIGCSFNGRAMFRREGLKAVTLKKWKNKLFSVASTDQIVQKINDKQQKDSFYE